MARDDERRETSVGGRELVAAWTICAVLLLALGLASAFETVLIEAATFLAEHR